MNITQTSIDPLGKSIPYVEKNFEVGLISSIIHTFILIMISLVMVMYMKQKMYLKFIMIYYIKV